MGLEVPTLEIRLLANKDIDAMNAAFAALKWDKPRSLFEGYLAEQHQDHRLIWVAFFENHFAGYVTLKRRSGYSYFQDLNCPEIIDFNILPNYRNKGFGSRLMDVAESAARQQSPIIGIGVGLTADYGAAQRLYVKRGYIPDGRGVTSHYEALTYNESICVDDELVLWFTKQF
jgi:GNAT superfamily N-acetyltransferase